MFYVNYDAKRAQPTYLQEPHILCQRATCGSQAAVWHRTSLPRLQKWDLHGKTSLTHYRRLHRPLPLQNACWPLFRSITTVKGLGTWKQWTLEYFQWTVGKGHFQPPLIFEQGERINTSFNSLIPSELPKFPALPDGRWLLHPQVLVSLGTTAITTAICGFQEASF